MTKTGRPRTLTGLCPCGASLSRDTKGRFSSKFCSPEHRIKYKKKSALGRQKDPKNWESRTCLWCSKMWDWRIGSGSGLYCSTKCSGESRRKPPVLCSFEGCGANVKGLGLCTGHYKQQKAGRDLSPLKPQGTADAFSCGHPRTEENSVENGKRNPKRCRECLLSKNKVWQHEQHKPWGSPEHLEKMSGNIKPSQLEMDCILLFEPKGYRHTGDGTFWVRGKDGTFKNPDFKKTGSSAVIEVWGDYWHQGQDPQGLIDWYAENGYECEVYWERDVVGLLEGLIPSVPSKMDLEKLSAQHACDLLSRWHSSLPDLHWSNITRNRHYACFGAKYRDNWFAVGLWSSPTSRALDTGSALELRRLAISLPSPRNTASWMIGKMVKSIKKDLPEIKRLVSYQDMGTHAGTIYAASGWEMGSKTAGRKGFTPKVRWEKAL